MILKKLVIISSIYFLGSSCTIDAYQQKHLIEVSEATFKKEVLDSPVPVFLVVYSKHNDTCRLMDAVWSDIQKELRDNGKVVLINFDKQKTLAQELGVVTVPTLMVYHKGKKLGTFELTMSPSEIKTIAHYILGLHIFTSLRYYRLLMKLLEKLD